VCAQEKERLIYASAGVKNYNPEQIFTDYLSSY
jgi:hypothetical protein